MLSGRYVPEEDLHGDRVFRKKWTDAGSPLLSPFNEEVTGSARACSYGSVRRYSSFVFWQYQL